MERDKKLKLAKRRLFWAAKRYAIDWSHQSPWSSKPLKEAGKKLLVAAENYGKIC